MPKKPQHINSSCAYLDTLLWQLCWTYCFLARRHPPNLTHAQPLASNLCQLLLDACPAPVHLLKLSLQLLLQLCNLSACAARHQHCSQPINMALH
jgi:hypothetical protein